MALKLYSKYFVDIVFGEGQLGFRIGKNDEEYSIVKGYVQKDDGTRLPLEGCGAVKKGDLIYAVNGETVIFMNINDVKDKLKKSKRPMTVRFVKPVSKSHYKTITAPNGEKRIKTWGDSDDYLPIRSLSINGMNDSYIMLRDMEAPDYALTPIYRNGPIFESEVRDFAFNGISDPKVRANVWKMLLRSYPFHPSKWEDSRKTNLEQYNVFTNEFIYSVNDRIGKTGCKELPNPIDASWKRSADYNPAEDDGQGNESKWSKEFGDGEMREIIWKDTDRTYSDKPFFHTHNRQVLARLLYVFGKLNSGVQYVQGMNELLAPLLYVFAEAEGQLEQEVSAEVEADTFFAFNNLMSETRDLFIKQMDASSMGIRGVLEELHSYIAFYIPAVAAHLDSLQVDPQFYAVRWLTTLFAREFELTRTFRIWDALLADPQRFMLMHCIGTAMVKLVDEQLLQSDFAGIMGLLQSYAVDDVEKVVSLANDVRLRKLKGVEEEVEETTSQKMMKAGVAIAGEVGDQMKKGWDVMKKKGLPFLSKFAQDTKSRVVSMTENVTQKLAKKEEEKKKNENESESEEEKPKKKSLKKKEVVEESPITPTTEADSDEIAYL